MEEFLEYRKNEYMIFQTMWAYVRRLPGENFQHQMNVLIKIKKKIKCIKQADENQKNKVNKKKQQDRINKDKNELI